MLEAGLLHSAPLPAHSALLDGAVLLTVLLVVVVCPVDGQPAPPLLGSSHGGEQEDVEDDEGDAGHHLHEDHAEPDH